MMPSFKNILTRRRSVNFIDFIGFKNKVVTSKCDKNMLETDSPTNSKRARVLSGNNNSGQDLRTTNPSYIEYNGTYFHISEFLFIQRGEVYMPSTSRNARWMVLSKINY